MEDKIGKGIFTFCIAIFALISLYTLYSIISFGTYNISIIGNITIFALFTAIGTSYYKEQRKILACLFFVFSLIPLASILGNIFA